MDYRDRYYNWTVLIIFILTTTRRPPNNGCGVGLVSMNKRESVLVKVNVISSVYWKGAKCDRTVINMKKF